MAQHEFAGVHVGHNVNDEQPVSIQGNQPTAPPVELQKQLESRQENISRPSLTGSDDLSHIFHAFVQTPVPDATLEVDSLNYCSSPPFSMPQYWPLSQESARFHVGHNVNDEQSVPIQGGQPTTPTAELQASQQTDTSRQFLTGHHGLTYMSHTFLETPFFDATHPYDNSLSQDLTGFNVQNPSPYLFCRNESPQAGQIPLSLLIPNSPIAATVPTGPSSTTTASSAQSPTGPSAAGTHATAEDDIRAVGSARIRQASARRRKKGGIYHCSFKNCNSTFTEPHNLGYHINSHLGLKPYECTKCPYAAASPATLRRHVQTRHPEVAMV